MPYLIIPIRAVSKFFFKLNKFYDVRTSFVCIWLPSSETPRSYWGKGRGLLIFNNFFLNYRKLNSSHRTLFHRKSRVASSQLDSNHPQFPSGTVCKDLVKTSPSGPAHTSGKSPKRRSPSQKGNLKTQPASTTSLNFKTKAQTNEC